MNLITQPETNLFFVKMKEDATEALKAKGAKLPSGAGKVDGGCGGVKAVATGKIAATSQQYPLKMAAMGVEAGLDSAVNGKKVKRPTPPTPA